jgi:hypothetical protein
MGRAGARWAEGRFLAIGDIDCVVWAVRGNPENGLIQIQIRIQIQIG